MTTKPKNCFTHEVRKFPMLLCLFPLICKKLIDSLISSIHGKIKKNMKKILGAKGLKQKGVLLLALLVKLLLKTKVISKYIKHV